jgi:peptidoglycan/LPS O-acetylase OafA/YrhL
MGNSSRSYKELTASDGEKMPQLDALRFFAVLGVLLVHFWGPQKLPGVLGFLDWGALGVRLFFVLSGFLITGILVGCRDKADAFPGNTLFFIRQFYLRRFLRIFPIYYLVLGLVVAVDLPPARQVLIWLLTYTTNIYITINEHWLGPLGHFWTLAVEEQFYIIWPWLVLLAPRKWLVPIMLVIIPIAPAYRYSAATHYENDILYGGVTRGTLTLACLDGLGLGALLALVTHSNLRMETIRKYLDRVILPIGILSFSLLLILQYYGGRARLFYTFGDLSAELVFCWVVGSASQGFKGMIGEILEFRPLAYLGKITYGIYVYHNLVPVLLVFVFGALGYEYQMSGVSNFLLSSAVTILIAALSWHFIERPINNLKHMFRYEPKHRFRLQGTEVLE